MSANRSQPLRETDLYEPIRDYLVSQGYTVRAEVADCDVVAYKEGELIVIELKRHFSADLLIQAIDRQRITDSVYVALPGPFDSCRGNRWHGIRKLLRRLEIGLIVVDLQRARSQAKVVSHPSPYRRRRLKHKRLAVLEEMIGRSGNRNLGGSTRQKLVTAYRETAIHIACCLERYGPLTPRQLRALGTGSKTTSILYKDVYGWFERVSRGLYALSSLGRAALNDYPDLVGEYATFLDELPSPKD
jgi:hypothetical protein